MSFLDFWNLLITKPKRFFTHHFDKKESPYFWFVLITFGIASTIERLDKELLEYDLRGDLESIEFVNNWPTYWASAFVGGFITGWLFYFVGGWFYNLRVKWAKGNPDRETSRFIYLYSSFIPAFPTVLLTLNQTLTSPKPYDPADEGSIYDLTVFVLVLILMYYSVYVSYVGVTTRMNPTKWRGRIWFLILPCCFYSLVILTLLEEIVYATEAS